MKYKYQKNIEFLFQKHYQEFCFFSYSYVGCMEEAEDLVQDVFVNILIKNPGFKAPDLKKYIAKAIKNESLKRITRAKRRFVLDESITETNPSQEQHIIDVESRLKIKMAIESLPDQCKKVFELCVFDGLKYDMAAEALGLSVNTVKSHMKEAYKKLRFTLRDTYFLILIFVILRF